MRRLDWPLLTMLLALGLCLGGASVAGASWVDYSGAWYSTDGDTNIFSASVEYLDGTTSADMNITDQSGTNSITVLQKGTPKAETIYFTKDKGNWFASLTKGQSDLNLGSSGHFWLDYGETTSYEYDMQDAGKQYKVRFNDTEQFQLTDAAPVPLPASAWILGAGLVGLMGLRKRFA